MNNKDMRPWEAYPDCTECGDYVKTLERALILACDRLYESDNQCECCLYKDQNMQGDECNVYYCGATTGSYYQYFMEEASKQ